MCTVVVVPMGGQRRLGRGAGMDYLSRPGVRHVLGQSGHVYSSPVPSSMLLGVEFRVDGESEGMSAGLSADGISGLVRDNISSATTPSPCGSVKAVSTLRKSRRSP